MTAYNENDPKIRNRPRVQTGNAYGNQNNINSPLNYNSSILMKNNKIKDQRKIVQKQFNPKRILEAPRRILYKAKRKLTPGEYLVELSIFNEYF